MYVRRALDAPPTGTRGTVLEEGKTSFSRWLRANPNLDARVYGIGITDLDYVVERKWRDYSDGSTDTHLMLIEEKRLLAEPTWSQGQTFKLLHSIIREGVKVAEHRVDGRVRRVRYFGFHLLQYEGMDFTTAKRVLWDRKPVTPAQVEEILAYERDPRTLELYRDMTAPPDWYAATSTASSSAALGNLTLSS